MSDAESDLVSAAAIDWSHVDCLQSRPSRAEFDSLCRALACTPESQLIGFQLWKFRHAALRQAEEIIARDEQKKERKLGKVQKRRDDLHDDHDHELDHPSQPADSHPTHFDTNSSGSGSTDRLHSAHSHHQHLFPSQSKPQPQPPPSFVQSTALVPVPSDTTLTPFSLSPSLAHTVPTANPSTISAAFGSPPRRLRGLFVHEELGRGAFGVVFRCTETAAGHPLSLALKQIPLARHSNATAIVDEVAILSQLDHPNIVHYYRSFVEGGALYIVMEFIEGVSLSQYVATAYARGDGLSEDAIWQIMTQIALALSYLHIDKNVIHRDLTLNNVMIDRKTRRVKLTDLGLARAHHRTNEALSGHTAANHHQHPSNPSPSRSPPLPASVPVGTLSYASPEVIQRSPHTSKSDLWSLGCILYALATGRPAFPGDNPLTLAQKIVHGSVAPLPPRFSPLLSEMVKRLLTVNPAQRPDIIQASSLMGPVLMAELDRQQQLAIELTAQRDTEREKRRQSEQQRKLARRMRQERGIDGHAHSPMTPATAGGATPSLTLAPNPAARGRSSSALFESPVVAGLLLAHKLAFAARRARMYCSPPLLAHLDALFAAESAEAFPAEILAMTASSHAVTVRHRASTVPSGASTPLTIGSLSTASSPEASLGASLPDSATSSPRLAPETPLLADIAALPAANAPTASALAELESAITDAGYYSTNAGLGRSGQHDTASDTYRTDTVPSRPSASRVLFAPVGGE